VLGIWESDTGLLWTVTLVADADWSTAVRDATRRPAPGGQSAVSSIDYQQLFDAIIEVIDPASGRLIASRRIPQFVAAVAGNGHLLSAREESGSILVEVLRVQLTTPGGEYGGTR
jgi:hypothetical protein